MAAEVEEELNKAQKRELKWERKQAKVKAAAEAAGQTYVAPPKDAKASPTDKMGKRKKRKLAALQLDGAADAKPQDSKQQVEVLVDGSLPIHAESTAAQSKAERKAAKKAKKASTGNANGLKASEPAAAAETANTVKPKKKKKKSPTDSSTRTDAAQPSDSQPAPVKKQKKAAASSTPSTTPHGRVRAHQEAVLASVGDQELAKSGKQILKDLYQEHSSVTAMTTEEVTKHRADRDTAVTGVDLRPVLQFDQAGNKIASSLVCHAYCIMFVVRPLAIFPSLPCLYNMVTAHYEHDSVMPKLQELASMLCVVCMSWLLLQLLKPYAAPDFACASIANIKKI